MSRRKRGRIIGVILAIVIVVFVGGYVAKSQLTGGETADAADSTAAGDSTVAAAEAAKGDKDEKGDEKKEPPPVPVEVALATNRPMSSFYLTTATLEPEKRVDILAKVAEEVVELVVEEGDVVAAGDLLCKLDDDEQRVALDEARINRDQRKSEFERHQAMYDEQLISDKEFADVKYQYELAVNAYEAARIKYEYTRIRAPFDGIVVQRMIDEGEHVATGAQLFVMADTDPLLLTMYLPETEIGTIATGQLVYINPDVNPEESFTGEIVRVAPEVDQRTGTIKVTAETRAGGIPGSFVRVRIVTDTRPNTLTVPRRGVVADAGDRFVFLAEADTVRKVAVKVGYENEDYAEVLEGIATGDSVVVAGVGGVRTGTRIKVLGRERDEAQLTESTQN